MYERKLNRREFLKLSALAAAAALTGCQPPQDLSQIGPTQTPSETPEFRPTPTQTIPATIEPLQTEIVEQAIETVPAYSERPQLTYEETINKKINNESLLKKLSEINYQVLAWPENENNPDDDILSYSLGRLGLLPHLDTYQNPEGKKYNFQEINTEGLAVFNNGSENKYLLVNVPLIPGAVKALSVQDNSGEMFIAQIDSNDNILKIQPAVFGENDRPTRVKRYFQNHGEKWESGDYTKLQYAILRHEKMLWHDENEGWVEIGKPLSIPSLDKLPEFYSFQKNLYIGPSGSDVPFWQAVDAKTDEILGVFHPSYDGWFIETVRPENVEIITKEYKGKYNTGPVIRTSPDPTTKETVQYEVGKLKDPNIPNPIVILENLSDKTHPLYITIGKEIPYLKNDNNTDNAFYEESKIMVLQVGSTDQLGFPIYIWRQIANAGILDALGDKAIREKTPGDSENINDISNVSNLYKIEEHLSEYTALLTDEERRSPPLDLFRLLWVRVIIINKLLHNKLYNIDEIITINNKTEIIGESVKKKVDEYYRNLNNGKYDLLPGISRDEINFVLQTFIPGELPNKKGSMVSINRFDNKQFLFLRAQRYYDPIVDDDLTVRNTGIVGEIVNMFEIMLFKIYNDEYSTQKDIPLLRALLVKDPKNILILRLLL